MTTVAFIGAGSTIFTRNLCGDILQRAALAGSTIRLMDIDPKRLEESEIVVRKLIRTLYLTTLRIMDAAALQDRAVLVERLRPRLAGARRALLFGSVARGEADEWSDLDLIVIADTDRTFFERFRDFGGLYEVWPRLDLLVYTSAEFEHMVDEENPFLLRALEEGVDVL